MYALFVADLQFCVCLIGKSMFLVLESLGKICGQTMKHGFRNKNVSEFVWKNFCSWEAKFYFCNNVSRGSKLGNITGNNIMFPGNNVS